MGTYYFSPSGLGISKDQHEALIAGDSSALIPVLLAMNNRQLCDLAWRAGLPYPVPLAYARGTQSLTPDEGRRLWEAFMNSGYCAHGYDQDGKPLAQDDGMRLWIKKFDTKYGIPDQLR